MWQILLIILNFSFEVFFFINYMCLILQTRVILSIQEMLIVLLEKIIKKEKKRNLNFTC